MPKSADLQISIREFALERFKPLKRGFKTSFLLSDFLQVFLFFLHEKLFYLLDLLLLLFMNSLNLKF